MRSRLMFCLAVLAAGGGSVADELRWKNGDVMPGVLLESGADRIRWSSPHWTEPWVLRIGSLASVEFDRPVGTPGGTWRILTCTGDFLLADLEGADDHDFHISSPILGVNRIGREAIRMMERVDSSDRIFLADSYQDWLDRGPGPILDLRYRIYALGEGWDREGERPGREAERRFPVPEAMMVHEHSIWLAVREGVLGTEEASALRERLRSVLDDQGGRGDPERMRKELLGDAGSGQTFSSPPGISLMDALGVLEAARRERFSTAAASLAMTWIDELLLVPGADRQAWIRELAQWESAEGFIPALEKGRKIFLSRLPTLSLPSVEPSLLRTEVQGRLWNLILTGKLEDREDGEASMLAGMDSRDLDRMMEQLEQDLAQGETEKVLRQLRLLAEAWEILRRDRAMARRRGFGEEEEILRQSALLLLERQADRLVLRDEEAQRRYYSGTRGTIRLWVQEERSRIREQAWGMGLRMRDRPAGFGIWDVDVRSLTGHPIYRKMLREVLSSDAYARWHRERQQYRIARMEAMREYAVARVDLRLHLSPSQRERARAATLAYDIGEAEFRERLLRNVPHRDLPRALTRKPIQGEATMIASLCRQIVRDLDSGFMTPWQRREGEKLQEEAEE